MTAHALYLRSRREITLHDFMTAHGLDIRQAQKALRDLGWKSFQVTGRHVWRRANYQPMPGHNTLRGASIAGARGAKVSPWGKWRGATTT